MLNASFSTSVDRSVPYQQLARDPILRMNFCDDRLLEISRVEEKDALLKKEEEDWDREKYSQQREYDDGLVEVLGRLHQRSIFCQDSGYYQEHIYHKDKENSRLREGAVIGCWTSRSYAVFGFVCLTIAMIIAVYRYYVSAHLSKTDIWNICFCLVAGGMFFAGAWCLNSWLLFLMRQVEPEGCDTMNIQSGEVQRSGSEYEF